MAAGKHSRAKWFLCRERLSVFRSSVAHGEDDAAALHAVDGLAVAFEEAEFVTGLHWQKELIRILNRPGWSIEQLRPWAATWFRAFIRHASLVGMALGKNTSIDGSHFDAVPRNLIVRGPDDATFTTKSGNSKSRAQVHGVPKSGIEFFGLTSVASSANQGSLALKDILFDLADGIGIPWPKRIFLLISIRRMKSRS